MNSYTSFGVVAKRLLPVVAIAIASVSAFSQSRLVGVTGDGGAPAESLFWLDQSDASSTLLMSLGAGSDGETIAYNPNDGLLYHASGRDTDPAWESINVDTASIVSSVVGAGYDEMFGLTFNAANGGFYGTDLDNQFLDVTTGGVGTFLGTVGAAYKGLAFVGGTLFAGEVRSNLLHTLNTADGSSLGSIGVTMVGASVSGMTGLATNPDDGVLWGVVKVGSARHLATIDTGTGVASSVGVLDTGYAGIAFVGEPVPEPASMIALGLGAVALLRRKRKSA